MHYLDVIILVIVIASAVEGGIHGFIYEVCSLLGLVAGFFLAINFFGELSPYLGFIPLPEWILKVISFLLILIVVNVVFRFVGKSLRVILRKIFMGWLDRLAGVIFGLARGVIVVLVITLILLLTPIGSIITSEAPQTRFMTSAIEIVRPFMAYLTGEHAAHRDAI